MMDGRYVSMYPPSLHITFTSESSKIYVKGLDRPCAFNLSIPTSSKDVIMVNNMLIMCIFVSSSAAAISSYRRK